MFIGVIEMFKLENMLFNLSDILVLEFELKKEKFKERYYILPLLKWEDNKYIYFYSMIIDSEGNIIDYPYVSSVQIDVEGMFQ